MERERSALKLALRKSRRRPSRAAAAILILAGATALAISTLTASSLHAMIGLGLVFWGAVLLLVMPGRYAKAILLDASTLPLLVDIDRMLADLNLNGTAVYLPPAHARDIRGGTVFVPASPAPPAKAAGGSSVAGDPPGICLAPPGLALANLLEDEMGAPFSQTKLAALPGRLEELFRDLEIAGDTRMTISGGTATVRLKKSVYSGLCREACSLPYICGSLGCPLCSSIALALARSSGEHVSIERSGLLPDGKTIVATFRMFRPAGAP